MRNESPSSRLAELRLLHLSSPSLPIGSFAYSQGLERAVDLGWIKNKTDCHDWLAGLMTHAMVRLDIPVLARCYRAWPHQHAQLATWDRFAIAARESAELRQEELDRGRMLMRCFARMSDEQEAPAYQPQSFVCAYSFVAWSFHIVLRSAAHAYLWSWLDNQVMAAIRLIPLGQSMGQQLLFHLAEEIPQAVDAGLSLEDNGLGASAPALALASIMHETQYTRLFRS